MPGRTDRAIRLRRWEFPNYWQDIVEPVESSGQAIGRMKELLSTFDLEGDEGVAFFLEDETGNVLEVDCSHRGWVLASRPADATPLISIGDTNATGHIPFLIPEWTETPRRHLIDVDTAEAVIRHWIETGELSDLIQWVE